MKIKQDKEHFIPIIDCPNCGAKDTPLSTKGPFVAKKGSKIYKRFEKKGGTPPEIWVSFCPQCERVPYDESEVKGYVSEEELIAMGWEKEDKVVHKIARKRKNAWYSLKELGK